MPKPSSINSVPAAAIILVHYQAVRETLNCLTSLQALDYPDFRICVVDNASGDDIAARIQGQFPDVTVLRSDTNLGYSGGNNRAIREALKNPAVEYVWLLNNDTTVDPSALSALVAMSSRTGGLSGSLMLYPDGRFQRVGTRVTPWTGSVREMADPRTGDSHPSKGERISLSGCSMLIPRQVIAAVGELTEDYFLYFEDTDYCLRAARSGYSCTVVPDSVVSHVEGASTGKNRPLVTYYYQRNRLMLLKRFWPRHRFFVALCYSHYRLFRSKIKTLCRRDPEAERHHRAFSLAVADFYQGTTGPCHHAL